MEDDTEENAYFLSITKKKTDVVDTNVINDEMIRKYIKQYNYENKIFGMDDMPAYDLVELRLSYQNILKIQNIEGFRSLRKLCLDNNVIMKIDGLIDLKNLEWLDLSFNNIRVVEGLEDLPNLTDLSLFHNQITEVSSGLGSNPKINVLSLGDNQIATFEPTITYLRDFPRLQVLKLDGNRVCNEMAYWTYVISHIPQLKYLDYILLDPNEIEKAREDHRDDLLAKEANVQSQEEQEKEMNEKKRKAELEEAFLVTTYNALEQVKSENEDDEDRIEALPNQPELFTDFSDKVRDMTAQFQKNVIEKNELRINLTEKFTRGVKQAESQNEAEAIELIRLYEKKEKQVMRIVDQDEDEGEIELKKILPEIDVLENTLIEKELNLVERLTDAITRFEKSLKKIVEDVKELAKNFQESVNHEVDTYFGDIEKIRDEQIKAFYAENANMEDFTDKQRRVYQERDLLNNAINTLSEEYKNKSFEIEEEITKAYEDQMNTFIEDFKVQQLERNRNQLKEIMDLAQEKRDNIQKVLSEF